MTIARDYKADLAIEFSRRNGRIANLRVKNISNISDMETRSEKSPAEKETRERIKKDIIAFVTQKEGEREFYSEITVRAITEDEEIKVVRIITSLRVGIRNTRNISNRQIPMNVNSIEDTLFRHFNSKKRGTMEY